MSPQMLHFKSKTFKKKGFKRVPLKLRTSLPPGIMPQRVDHALKIKHKNLWAQHVTGRRGFFFFYMHSMLYSKNVWMLAVSLCCRASQPGLLTRSKATHGPHCALEPSPCFVRQQLIQTSTFGASHHERTLLFCTPLLSY